MKKIGRIGENVKIVCPIGGYPAPIIEWSKNGEKIDYMWDRHRTGKKSLKIKHVNADDTGIFTCKGTPSRHLPNPSLQSTSPIFKSECRFY